VVCFLASECSARVLLEWCAVAVAVCCQVGRKRREGRKGDGAGPGLEPGCLFPYTRCCFLSEWECIYLVLI